MLVARGWWEGKGESYCLMGIKFQLYKMKSAMGNGGNLYVDI